MGVVVLLDRLVVGFVCIWFGNLENASVLMCLAHDMMKLTFQNAQ